MRTFGRVILGTTGRLASIPGVSIFLLLNFVYASAFALSDEIATAPHTITDARALGSGLSRWIVGIYNHDLLIYGLTVVGVMVAMGVIIGFALDYLVSHIGIDLGKLERRE